MRADGPVEKASESLKKYISELQAAYGLLVGILTNEAEDIAESDEVKLSSHISLEQQTVRKIRSLTVAIRTYLEHVNPDEESLLRLKEIEALRDRASAATERNIESLRDEMRRLKLKMTSVKLPQSARRVYYSGNNPTLMDIEI